LILFIFVINLPPFGFIFNFFKSLTPSPESDVVNMKMDCEIFDTPKKKYTNSYWRLRAAIK